MLNDELLYCSTMEFVLLPQNLQHGQRASAYLKKRRSSLEINFHNTRFFWHGSFLVNIQYRSRLRNINIYDVQTHLQLAL
jgi:hypothetical protein